MGEWEDRHPRNFLADGEFVEICEAPVGQRVIFVLPTADHAEAMAWREEHLKQCPQFLLWRARHPDGFSPFGGMCAESYSWRICPSTVGAMITLRCCCGAEHDLPFNP